MGYLPRFHFPFSTITRFNFLALPLRVGLELCRGRYLLGGSVPLGVSPIRAGSGGSGSPFLWATSPLG